jgi:hypothetical protein
MLALVPGRLTPTWLIHPAATHDLSLHCCILIDCAVLCYTVSLMCGAYPEGPPHMVTGPM